MPDIKEIIQANTGRLLGEMLGSGHADAADGVVGPYRLIEPLGDGGFGMVWRAEQTEPVRREVALKLVKLGMDTMQVLARFDQERQALAGMDHPCVSKLLEAGATTDGRPYFAMELVHGEPITCWCARTRPTLEERLRLFIHVCEAVQHAHQKGIIHRDLKPTNILVTTDGALPMPKVIDFGIAKAMRAETLEEYTLLTQNEHQLGTPRYMSPEQIEGNVVIDTRSDIYSLGVLLYELLTDTLPFDSAASEAELKRMVSNLTPPRPSSTVLARQRTADGKCPETTPPGETPPVIPADLDWITLCALEKDPSRRYQTADAFAADLQRFIDHEPVLARPPSFGYVTGRWIRRNQTIFAAACITVAALLGGTAVAIWQARNALQALHFAEAETARANFSLAEAALREGNGQVMQVALQKVPENLRDSTWNYLLEQSDTSIPCGLANHGKVSGAAAHPKLPGVFAVADHTGKVRLIEWRTGRLLLEFEPAFHGQAHGIACVAFSADGERIATGRVRLRGIVIHSTRDGKKLMEWDADGSESLEFSPDGKLLLQTVDGAPSIHLWHAADGSAAWSYPPEPSTGVHGVFTPGGQQVVATKARANIQSVNALDGTVIHSAPCRLLHLTALATHPDGTIVIANQTGFVSRLEPRDGRVLTEFHTGNHAIDNVAITPDGERIVTQAKLPDGRQDIRLWDAATGRALQTLLGGSGYVTGLTVHPLSGELLVAGSDARAWNLVSRPAQWTLQGLGYMGAAFFGTEDLLLSRAPGVHVALMKLQAVSPVVLWKPDDKVSRRHLSVSADGRFAAIGALQSGATISLLRKTSASIEPVTTVFQRQVPVLALRLNPTGDRLAAISYNNVAVALFDSTTGMQPVPLESPAVKRFWNVGWTGGRHLLGLVTTQAERGLIGSEEWILLWDTSTGKIIRTAPHRSTMNALAVAPDGHLFAEAGEDKLVRIRDTTTLAVQQEFRAHDGAITALAWHPTRPILATASTDLCVRFWDLETGRRLEELRGFSSPVTHLAFSPGGERLASSNFDATHVWDLPDFDNKSAPPQKTDD